MYSFSIVEATILRTVYCRFLVLVCVVGADISSRRRYPWSVFLILATRSCGTLEVIIGSMILAYFLLHALFFPNSDGL